MKNNHILPLLVFITVTFLSACATDTPGTNEEDGKPSSSVVGDYEKNSTTAPSGVQDGNEGKSLGGDSGGDGGNGGNGGSGGNGGGGSGGNGG